MAINLREIYYSTKIKFKISLIAGEGGLDNLVSWVHVLENIEATGFIHGNELLITTGVTMNSTDWLNSYIEKIIENKACGLIINTGAFINEIPSNIIDLCNKNKFPLFTVPWDIHLVDIIRVYCNKIVQSNQSNLTVASAFKNAIFYPEKTELYESHLQRNNFNLDSTFAIIVLKIDGLVKDTEFNYLTNKINMLLQTHFYKFNYVYNSFLHIDMIIIVLNQINEKILDNEAKKLDSDIKSIFSNYKYHIGVSALISNISSLPILYKQALLALDISKRHNQSLCMFEANGINKLLLSINNMELLKEIYTETLGKLEEYDLKHNTDFVETLRLYLSLNSSVQAVADVSFTHRNTINYRIKKIKSIVDSNFDTNEERFRFQLAFYIKNII
jgi:DNA-binding PucR family transcriptional regulator